MSTSESQRPQQSDRNELSALQCEEDDTAHGSDDEPMVYEIPHDYASDARQHRDRLVANGTDPAMVILQSELRNHISRQDGESSAEYSERCCNTLNSMISRGVVILNDKCTVDVVASRFGTGDGRSFDLDPRSGATKGEFRKFSQWFSEGAEAGKIPEAPEKWKKFQKQE